MPFAIFHLFSGLVAPFQLKVMYADSLLRLTLSGFILSLDLTALITSHGTRCISQQLPLLGTTDALHYWIAVDALSLAVQCTVTALILKQCGDTLQELEVELPEPTSADPEAFES